MIIEIHTLKNNYEHYLLKNNINLDKLETYDKYELVSTHRVIHDFIIKKQMLLIIGKNVEEAMKDNDNLIANARKDLELVESILRNKNLKIPNYNFIWKLSQLLKLK